MVWCPHYRCFYINKEKLTIGWSKLIHSSNDAGMLRMFQLTKALVWCRSICRIFNLHLCNMIPAFLIWVRCQEPKLLWATEPLSWALYVPRDSIRHLGMLSICSGRLLLWCMHNHMNNLDMLFFRWAAVPNIPSLYTSVLFRNLQVLLGLLPETLWLTCWYPL